MKRVTQIIFTAVLALFCVSCASRTYPGKPDQKAYYIKAKDLPRVIAVLPPTFEDQDQSSPLVKKLIRSTLQNYLVGKGFSVKTFQYVDNTLEDKDLKELSIEDIAHLLKVDGVVCTHTYTVSDLNIALLQYYKVDAEVSLYAGDGKLLGKWREASSKRKVSIAMDPVGAAAAVLGDIISTSGEAQLKSVIYDWAWKISNVLPGFPESSKIPQITKVITNIQQPIFKMDEKIAVVMEGDKNLEVTLDIGDFRKDINMVEFEPGHYKGIYVVQQGDSTRNQILAIKASKPDGTKREWLEMDRVINIDGIAPAPPKDVKAQVTEEGVTLSFTVRDPETVALSILRSETPLEGFHEIGKTSKFQYLDTLVEEGKTYYYRVLGIDEAGNLSKPEKTVAVTIPFFEERLLSGEVEGPLIKGNYLVEKGLVIPASKKLAIEKGARLKFAPGANITVKGELTIDSAILKGMEDERWGGIEVSENGELFVKGSIISDCECGIIINDARLALKDTILQTGGIGIQVNSTVPFEMEKVQVSRFEKGIVIETGTGEIRQSSLRENGIGIQIHSGDIRLESNNICENEINLLSDIKLVLKGNYLGSLKVKDLRLKGDIEVKTLLDLPFPDGKEMALDSKELDERVIRLKKEAIDYFNHGNYGNAYEVFNKVLSLKDDKEVYIYMAFVLEQLREESKLEAILKKGIEIYPYEVRLYQTYVRYLVSRDKTEEAKNLLERALTLNPGNAVLNSLKELLSSE